ncbi:MAG: GEVED domain-containing protein [Bacteroidetes bacterium]|nr:GEVED domain-containing protein [Bacteroidota bacterium]
MKTKTTFNLRIKTKWFLMLIVLFVLSFNVKAQLSYCAATGGCDEYISNVSFNNINNATGCNNYTFYSALAAINVVQGNSYPITVTNGNFYGNDSCEVWIDWNRDTVFDNATEYYKLVNSSNPYTGTISVPYTALTGETRMRVRIRYYGNINPCGNAGQSYGEVEDYKINVIAGSPMVLGNIMFNQFSGIAVPGNQNVNVSYLRILTSGGLNPLFVKNITLNSLNSYPYISDAQLYSINFNSNTSYTTIPFGSLINNPSGNILSFNDSVTLKPDTNYFLLTYSVSNSAPIGTHLKSNLTTVNVNDTDYAPNSIDTSLYVLVVPPMSGNYTINNLGNGDYLNFNQAVNALITRGISGPVVFNVDNGTYYEQILIPSIAGSSSTNTITFKSTNNNNNGVILTYTPIGYNDNYTIQIQSSSNIIFQDLTISSGYSTNYSRVFNITGASGNLSFIGNNIIGSESYSGWNYNLSLMYFSSMGSQMSNILIYNNTFINGSFGVWFDNYGPLSLNNTFTENYFYNQGIYAILVSNQSNLMISHNTIYADLSISSFYGIETDNCYGGIIIKKNRINVKNSSSMYGIVMNSTSGNITPSHIVNNFISLQLTSNSNYGISLNSDSTIGVLNNSINITGGNNSSTYGLYIQNSAGLFFRNNIVSNTSHGMAIYAGICNQCSSNYNDYYSNGFLAYLSQADTYFYDLSEFVSATHGDSNSISVFPQFLSDTNLHTFNIALNGRGTPIPGVNTDIDGDTRNATTPDIGADEFDPPAYDLEFVGFLNVPNGCGLSNNEKIKVIIKNSGTANYIAGNATVKFQVDLPQQLVNETLNRNIASGDTIQYTFTSGANLSVNSLLHDSTLSVNAWVNYTGDNNHFNDTIYTTLLSRYLPALPVVTDTIIKYSTKAILNAQLPPNFIPLWYDSLTSVNILKIGNPYITPNLFSVDTFYVSSKKTGLDYGTIATSYTTSVLPFYSYYPDIRTQFLYTAQELKSTGLMPGPITSLAFNISSYSSTPMNGFTIKMQNSSLTSLSSFIETGWSTVFSNTYTVSPAYGWQDINFQTPFIWDGISNILINNCFDNTAYGSNSSVYISYLPTPNMMLYSYSSSGSGCTLTYPYTYSYRPDIRFKGTMMGNGCESNRAALRVGLNNIPGKDVGVTSILMPNSGFEISNPVDVKVIVKNYGSSNTDTIFVSYKKADTSLAITETVIRNIASGDTIQYTFTQKANISALGTYNFKAYARSTSDTVYMNDTAYKTVQNFTYCSPVMSYGCSVGAINSVIINTLNNTGSGCNPNSGSQIIYPESAFTTSLQKSISYPVTLSPVNNSYYIGYGIWIDLNHDGDFDDTGEFLFNTYTSTNATGSISIPSTYSFTGKTKMRIRAYRNNYLNANNSCTTFSEYGETEDYTITILPEPLQKDLQLISIVSPDTATYQLIAKNVTVQVKNIGLDTITQIPLTYIFNSQTPVNYTWNGQLAAQQFLNINLPQITPNTANNSIRIYSALSGDLDHTNDTLYKTFVALPAPALIGISPDTVFALIASCDSSSTQILPLTINNNGYQALNYQINQNTGMSDDFESGTNKWIFEGGWGLISDGYNSLHSLTESPSGYYGNNWNYNAQLKDSMYIANKDSSYISFMLKFSVESCCDRLNPQISINNGSWITIANYGNTGSEAWNLKMIPISSYVNNGDYVKFRFNFYSDYSVVSDGVVIDNLFINGIENGNWATFSKTKDTIQTGGNSVINVTFKVGQLNAGLHSQNVIIRSNDPTKPVIKLPLYLTIIGAPKLDIYDSIRVMSSVMAGVTSSSTFKLYNNGCDSLKITALNHNDNAFSLVYPVNIMPRDSGVITVNFNSLLQGLHSDTLTLFNNSGTKHFFLSGTVLPTPHLVFIPDSFVVYSSNCSDTIYKNLKIKNTGNTTLNWDAYFSKGAEKALSFNGTNSEVDFGNLGAMPQKGSIEFWVKTNINNTTKVLFSSSGMNYSWRGINIYQGSNYYYAIIGDDVGNYYTSYTITSNVDYGKWHHIAVTWDKTQNKVWTYWDGNVVTNGSSNTYWPTTLQEARFGIGYSSAYNYFFDGQIDEFRLWSQTRSQTEIKSSYQEAMVIPTPALVGLWGFNEVSGDSVYGFNTNKNGLISNITRINSGANVKKPGLDVYPLTGVLNAGDSNNVQVTFITTGLNSGNIYSGIGLKTTDPLNQVVIVPTHLILSGAAQMQLFTNNLNFNNIMAGATITDSVGFTNTGCDSLKITNITHSNSIFTLNKTSFTLLPKDTARLKITFNPVNIGTYNDSITFYTNIGNKQVFIHAQAVAAPVASVSPSSIFDTITVCNQSNSKTFKIKNTGNEILTWTGITSVIGVSDNFESGLSKWTFSGNWGTINQGYNGGNGLTESPSGSYPNNAYQYIELKDSIYILNKDSCKIRYMLKHNMECCCDYLYTQISVNGGVWTSLSPSFNCNEDWSLKQFQFSSYVNNGDYVKFRFLFTSDGSVVGDGVVIDDFSINSLNVNNISPSSGTVALGDSTTVQLNIDGQGLVNGKRYKS